MLFSETTNRFVIKRMINYNLASWKSSFHRKLFSVRDREKPIRSRYLQINLKHLERANPIERKLFRSHRVRNHARNDVQTVGNDNSKTRFIGGGFRAWRPRRNGRAGRADFEGVNWNGEGRGAISRNNEKLRLVRSCGRRWMPASEATISRRFEISVSISSFVGGIVCPPVEMQPVNRPW